MKTCILEAITELESQMTRMEIAVEILRGLNDGPEPTQTPAATEIIKAAKPKRKPNAAAKAQGTLKDGSRARALSQARALLQIARTLPEPITALALMKAAKLPDIRPAAGALWRWHRDGYLKRVGIGEYQRTKKYPNESTEVGSARVAIPGLDEPDKPSLTEQLKKAEDDYNEAKNANQNTLAEILARKVDNLKRKLAEQTE